MRTATIPRGDSVSLPKPAGGYQFIPAIQLALAWWAYQQNSIRLADLRVWFACWELRARRCRMPAPLPRRFSLDELERLTGLSPRRLRASIRRLEAARLLAWSDSALAFPDASEALAGLDREAFRSFFDAIPNHRRRVPAPRRILRLLAGGCRPALIAAILGHLFRCLYIKDGECLPIGRAKASWIAEAFGVDIRRVKQARRELIDMGWLIPLESPQWALNRWGALVRVNLEWSPLDRPGPAGADGAGATDQGPAIGGPAPTTPELATTPEPKLPPPLPGFEPELAPPDSSDENPLTGEKNQKPAAGGPSGFFKSQQEGRTAEHGQGPATFRTSTAAAACQTAPPAPPRPDLRHVVPEDLKDIERLLDLYGQAVELGLVADSEHGRLRFVAAAEHARVIGTKNPCGLFARLVHGRLLHFVTYDEEVAASARLRRYLYGAPAEPGPAPRMAAAPAGPVLSDDARLARAARAAAMGAGYRGDVFPLLKRARPDWTRERWDRAMAELDRQGAAPRFSAR